MRKYRLAAVVVVITFAIIIAVEFVNQPTGRNTSVIVSAPLSPTSAMPPMGSPVDSMSFDVPGVSQPTFVTADKSGLRDDDVVIGVDLNGESRAYHRRAFERGPASHVVNDLLASIPVTITHCDLTRCTRVLTSGNAKETVDIRCGGWLAVQGMVLLVGEKRYPQSSKDIPLIDLPFVVSTWKKWRQEHPNSMVYLGDALNRENGLQSMPGTEIK